MTTFKDGGEATFDPVFAGTWRERLSALTGGIPPLTELSVAAYFQRLGMLMDNYAKGDEARFRAVKARFGATHVLCERMSACGNLHFPIVYEDAFWRLFEITPAP